MRVHPIDGLIDKMLENLHGTTSTSFVH